jgi:hypothetical protein
MLTRTALAEHLRAGGVRRGGWANRVNRGLRSGWLGHPHSSAHIAAKSSRIAAVVVWISAGNDFEGADCSHRTSGLKIQGIEFVPKIAVVRQNVSFRSIGRSGGQCEDDHSVAPGPREAILSIAICKLHSRPW